MNLVEVTYPAGALTAAERTELAGDILHGFFSFEAVPEATLRRARRMTHVYFREAHDWTTGDGPLPRQTPPPIIVTITVPEAWRAELSRGGIGIVRAALNRLSQRHGWQRTGGDVWINVIGVADGSIGLNGKPATAAGVVNYMTAEYQAEQRTPPEEHGQDGDRLRTDVVIDPICGMRVRLGRNATTLERHGVTLGFCSTGCRDAYLTNEAAASTD